MDLKIESPDQVWLGDIMYIQLQQEFVYLAVLMDVFTRVIWGLHLAGSLDQSVTLTALKESVEKGCPEIHHSEQGVQYAANDDVKLLQEHDIKISIAEGGQAWQNDYAERLKKRGLTLSEYRNFTEAYQQIERFWRSFT